MGYWSKRGILLSAMPRSATFAALEPIFGWACETAFEAINLNAVALGALPATLCVIHNRVFGTWNADLYRHVVLLRMPYYPD
jgi:hypothetical protein